MSVDVLTFGCRLNTYEFEVIRRHAAAAGLSDVVIVNTCAVTAEAERQARQAIRRRKRERPQARIVVTGCAAQTNPERFAAMAEVDRVVGNDGKISREAWSATAAELARPNDFGVSLEQKIVVNDIMSVKETAAHLIEGIDGRTRAYRPGAERLRSSLHLLHHPVRSRQLALGADGRSGRAGAAPR